MANCACTGACRVPPYQCGVGSIRFEPYPSDAWRQRPLRQGEMRSCMECGGAQLGPGNWAYAGPICYCGGLAAPMTPDIFQSAFPRLDRRGKPIYRVKAGSAPCLDTQRKEATMSGVRE